MEINADYLRELSKVSSKASIKANEILNELINVARDGDTRYTLYVNEEVDGLYRNDIDMIVKLLEDKELNVVATSDWDEEECSDIWKMQISW